MTPAATTTAWSGLSGRTGSPLPAVLCVDDDAFILDGFRRQLRNKFNVYTAEGPREGLETVSKNGPFTVIVSDFQMPGMNGIEFLTRVRALAPDSVRVMLTGQADFATAIAAVNQGNIFRFLVKPCAPLVFEKVLQAGLEQHRLLIAERQLTEETLLGCVQALVEVLSIVQPEAFSQSNRVRRYVRQIADGMGITIGWQIEAAAMLSQIGWITLSPHLLAKASASETLSGEDAREFQKHASAAARILEKIPRLDQVAKIIERQQKPIAGATLFESGDPVAVGSVLLKAAIDFDCLRSSGLSHDKVWQEMRRSNNSYLPRVLEAIGAIEKTEAQDEIRIVPLSGLRAGMIMEEELKSLNGMLLLGKGLEVPSSFVQRLGNYSYGLAPDFRCRVRIRPAGVKSG